MQGKKEVLGQNLTASEAAAYTEAYHRGSGLVMKYIDLHDQEPVPLPVKEAEVREGIRLLQRAVTLEPRSWPAHWLIGKAHQALGDHPRACEAFRQATRLCKDNPDVPRELCLECLHLGKRASMSATSDFTRPARTQRPFCVNHAIAVSTGCESR